MREATMWKIGTNFKDAASEASEDDTPDLESFYIGFVNGQAEKVFLGACPAAVFRPSSSWRPELFTPQFIRRVVRSAAERYGLFFVYDAPWAWIAGSEETAAAISCLSEIPVNAPKWHKARGLLCGVPYERINEKFHETAIRPKGGTG